MPHTKTHICAMTHSYPNPSHIWMRHDTHKNKSQHTYERDMAHIVGMRGFSIYV